MEEIITVALFFGFIWLLIKGIKKFNRPAPVAIKVPEVVLNAGESIGHPNLEDFAKSVYWAKEVLNNKEEYVILDTETTGLGKNDVVIQIGVIDLSGNVLFDSLIRPTKRKRMPKSATAIHGITMKMLETKPTFVEVQEEIKGIIDGKEIIIYNFEYDERLLDQTTDQDGVGYLRMNPYHCAMKMYSQFKGEWNDYYGDYRYQKLPSGDHSAVGDCQATLKVIEEMAAYWPANDEFV